MEVNRPQHRLIFPYIILAIVVVCTALILFELWGNVDGLIVRPTQTSAVTPTLWWQTPHVTPSTSSEAAAPPAVSTPPALETPAPIPESARETQDD